MTDSGFNIADLATISEDELVFDDEILVEPIVAEPVATAPAPPADTARPRRTPRRGRADVEAGSGAAVTSEASPASPPVSTAAPPAPEEIPASAAAHPAAAEEPAGPPAPVPQPDVGPAGFDRRNALLLAIVIFSLLTSLLSLGGLIAVGRTLAHAEADRARAEDERSALVRVPEIVKALDDATNKLALAASRTPGGPPATAADMKQALDELRLSLAEHQPDGLGALNGITRDGLNEIGTRLDRLSAQISGVRAAPVPSRPMPHNDDPS